MRGHIYALYKGEKFLDEGTKKEIADRRGCKVSTMSFLASNAYKKRMETGKGNTNRKRGNYLILIEIDDDE